MTTEDPTSADASPEGPEDPARRWPFGVLQTVVLIVVCAVTAAAVGWQVGERDRDESFAETDAGFLEDMIVHHNGAVTLGLEYLGRANDDVVTHFAREIVTTQSAEMAVMNLLVDDAGNPEVATNGVAMDWMGHPMDPAEMPGMATASDYSAVRASTGLAADDLFTRLMIRHHAAGIAMATRASADGANPRVRRLARTMATVQRTEIDEMNRRRLALGLDAIDASPAGEPGMHHSHSG
ncbi:MAG: DUF305 domain-containing protein [Actinomycetota bacterium]